MRNSDQQPVVLITGGGTGIGAAVALKMAASHRVIICGRRAEPLERVAAQADVITITKDIAAESASVEIVSQIIAAYGRLDHLVLNAGIVRSARIGDMALADWRAQIEINLTAAFALIRESIRHLIAAKGAIVGVSSLSSQRLGHGLAAYSASKAGLNLLIQGVALEYGESGVRANVVCPGWVRTEMADAEMAALSPNDLDSGYRWATRNVPQKRAAQPAEIAEVIAWLLSPAASYVNGAVLNVDGGSAVVSPGLVDLEPPPKRGPSD